jgi:hypothetical protein
VGRTGGAAGPAPKGGTATSPQAARAAGLQPAPRANPAPTRGASAGERAFLEKVGAGEVNPNIRVMIDRETALFAKEDLTLTERLMFWADKPEPGVVVDAEKEAQRLREAAASGRPANEGEVAIIQRRARGLLEGLF